MTWNEDNIEVLNILKSNLKSEKWAAKVIPIENWIKNSCGEIIVFNVKVVKAYFKYLNLCVDSMYKDWLKVKTCTISHLLKV